MAFNRLFLLLLVAGAYNSRLQEVLVENPHGQVSCKTIIDLTYDKFGVRERSTGSWIRRAFPKVYMRRSNKFRFYCGVSLKTDAARAPTEDDLKNVEWTNTAVEWLKENLAVDPGAKVKSADLYRAINEGVGHKHVDNSIAAFRMVFPFIPKKVFNGSAYYVGIRFTDALIEKYRNSGSVFQPRIENSDLQDVEPRKDPSKYSTVDMVLVAWLQTALEAGDDFHERLRTIGWIIKKKFGDNLPEEKILKFVRKAFPTIRLAKDPDTRENYAAGVRIKDTHKQKENSWMQIVSEWMNHAFKVNRRFHGESLLKVVAFLMQKLELEEPIVVVNLVRDVFPEVVIKRISDDVQIICGLRLNENSGNLPLLEFDADDKIESLEFLRRAIHLPDEEEEEIEDETDKGMQEVESIRKRMFSDQAVETEALLEKEDGAVASSQDSHDAGDESEGNTMESKMAALVKELVTTKVELERVKAENDEHRKKYDTMVAGLQQNLASIYQKLTNQGISSEAMFGFAPAGSSTPDGQSTSST